MGLSTARFNKMHYDSKGFRKLMVFAQEMIDPELATALLSLNHSNRPVKSATLKKYTEDMEKENWKFTGDIINISKTANLLNGQHRLMAIVASGKAQMFNIQSGLEDEAFEYMDAGKNRTAADALAVKGYENYGTISGMLRFVMMYQRGRLKGSVQGTSNRVTIHELSEFADKQDQALMFDCAKQGARCFKKFKTISAPTYAGFLFIFSLLNKDEAFAFFDMLTSGENISTTSYSMVYLLRQRLINMTIGSGTMRTADKYALIIKAWNAYRKNKEIKALQWQSNEDFPTAI